MIGSGLPLTSCKRRREAERARLTPHPAGPGGHCKAVTLSELQRRFLLCPAHTHSLLPGPPAQEPGFSFLQSQQTHIVHQTSGFPKAARPVSRISVCLTSAWHPVGAW